MRCVCVSVCTCARAYATTRSATMHVLGSQGCWCMYTCAKHWSSARDLFVPCDCFDFLWQGVFLTACVLFICRCVSSAKR